MRRLATTALVVALSACGTGHGASRQGGTGLAGATSGDVTFDRASVPASQRGRFDALAARLPSPCDKTQTLATALAAPRSCVHAAYAARSIVRELADTSDDRIARQHARRYFDSPTPFTLDAPFEGMPDAPVVLVEFFDYDCGYCRMFVPMLEQVLAEFPSEVRLHYKFFPLSIHPQSEAAARAAVAAERQGKFLEMHRLLFNNQGRHSDEDLYGYARTIGLDMARFEADFQSEGTRARIAHDREEGDRAGLEGTPSLFIDGRACETLSVPDITEWVREVLSSKPISAS